MECTLPPTLPRRPNRHMSYLSIGRVQYARLSGIRGNERIGPIKNTTFPTSAPPPSSADRPDVRHRVPCAAAADVLLHAAGVALRLRRLPGTLRVRRGAPVVVEEVCARAQQSLFSDGK